MFLDAQLTAAERNTVRKRFKNADHQGSTITSKVSAQQITVRDLAIRDLKTIDDLSQLKAVEKEVWGMADEDTLPLTLAIALKTAGNIFVGAFLKHEPEQRAPQRPEQRKDKHENKEQLVGFAFGFLARERGEITIHSHMLAVLDPYRHLDLGFRLKQAQRERVLAMGIREMTWTFDPLQSRNAHFNFSKLGVVSDTYKVDFYGPETSSILHRNGTDRLWVRWILNARRVRERLSGRPASGSPNPSKDFEGGNARCIKAPGTAGSFRSQRQAGPSQSGGSSFRKAALKHRNPRRHSRGRAHRHGFSQEWREATRWAFREALKNGIL